MWGLSCHCGSQGSLVKAKQNRVHFSTLLLALPIFKIILLFLGTALGGGLHFPECLVASLRARPCLWVFPSLSWRDSFAHSDKRHMLLLNRCVCCCSRPWASIMWSAQQIWGKRLSSKWIPRFHSPHSHLPSLSASLRLLPGQLLGPWIIPLVRAGPVGSCCRAGDAGGLRAGSPLLLTMASLKSACKTAWAFVAQVACSHPPFLGIIGDSWKAVRPPRSDWVRGSAQPNGEHPGPRPATCSGGLLSHGGLVTGVIDLGQQKATFHQEKAVWQLQSRVAWLFLSKRKNTIGEKKAACIYLYVLLGKKSCLYLYVLLGKKSCLYLSIHSIGEKKAACIYLYVKKK